MHNLVIIDEIEEKQLAWYCHVGTLREEMLQKKAFKWNLPCRKKERQIHEDVVEWSITHEGEKQSREPNGGYIKWRLRIRMI